ncbi:hypothetical protein [Shinella sp.]|uniref:hypothetical protein n=1 Tax=Shinella sp. TaxID=1870904 RepID=UPI00301CDC15
MAGWRDLDAMSEAMDASKAAAVTARWMASSRPGFLARVIIADIWHESPALRGSRECRLHDAMVMADCILISCVGTAPLVVYDNTVVDIRPFDRLFSAAPHLGLKTAAHRT